MAQGLLNTGDHLIDMVVRDHLSSSCKSLFSLSTTAFWRSGGLTCPSRDDVDCLAELDFEDDQELVNLTLGAGEVEQS
ncbi:hypothetical protein TIFTF001_009838 [Ficus carica]|uniref:Uncharacterized protein n=1 Tax=Ficus carica TaxID=3494 RepID=A0AA87ZVZ5_FICCA|nr:hypothetical protein TIFTF001_009838 [Ficus carica]